MPYLSPLTSRDQTLVLAGLALLPSSDELERSSSTGQGNFLFQLQESSLSYECLTLIGSVSTSRCNQSVCVASHMSCATSIIWIVYEGQGCIFVSTTCIC